MMHERNSRIKDLRCLRIRKEEKRKEGIKEGGKKGRKEREGEREGIRKKIQKHIVHFKSCRRYSSCRHPKWIDRNTFNLNLSLTLQSLRQKRETRSWNNCISMFSKYYTFHFHILYILCLEVLVMSSVHSLLKVLNITEHRYSHSTWVSLCLCMMNIM